MSSHFVVPTGLASPPRASLPASPFASPQAPLSSPGSPFQFATYDAWNKAWTPPVNISSVQSLLAASEHYAGQEEAKDPKGFLCASDHFDGVATGTETTFQLAQLSFDTLLAAPSAEWKAKNCRGLHYTEDPSPRQGSVRRSPSGPPGRRPKAVPSVEAVVHSLEEGDKEVYSLSFLAKAAQVPSLDAAGVKTLLCSSPLNSAAEDPSSGSGASSTGIDIGTSRAGTATDTGDLPFQPDWGARMTSGAAVSQLGEYLLYQPPQEWKDKNCQPPAAHTDTNGSGAQGERQGEPLIPSAWKKGGHPIPLAAAYIPPSPATSSEEEDEDSLPMELPPYQLLLSGLQVQAVTGIRPEEQLRSLFCQTEEDFWPGKTSSGRRFKQLTKEGILLRPNAGFVTSYCSRQALKQAAVDAAAAAPADNGSFASPAPSSYWPLQTFSFSGNELPPALPSSLKEALHHHDRHQQRDGDSAAKAVDVPLPLAYLYDRSTSSWQAAYTEEWLAGALDLPRKVTETWLKDKEERSPEWVKRLFTTTTATVSLLENGGSEGSNFTVPVHAVSPSFSSSSPYSAFVLADAYHRARVSRSSRAASREEEDEAVVEAMALGEKPSFEPVSVSGRRLKHPSAATLASR